MLDPKLIKTIWATAREFNLAKEEVHEAIFAGWKKASVKDLTKQEAYRLLDGMRGCGKSGVRGERRRAMGTHGRKGTPQGTTEYMVTDAEREILWQAAFARNWTGDSLRAFCNRQLGHEEPLTMREFNKILWAIKAMNRRDEERRKKDLARQCCELDFNFDGNCEVHSSPGVLRVVQEGGSHVAAV